MVTMRYSRLKLSAIFLVFLLLLPAIVPQTTSKQVIEKKQPIKIAFIWQRWDILDIPAPIGMMIYKRILRQAEKEYGVEFEIYSLWDRWRGGDVQRGMLTKLDIDVVIGPGGFGGWNCPRDYRMKIRQFVRSGGSFYGICGDSTFGSLGAINLPEGYKFPLKKATGSWGFTPMLGLANVVTDASAFDHILTYPFWIKKTDVIKTATQLPISRAPILIEPSLIPIHEPYYRNRVRVMLGNAPLVDGPYFMRLFMPKVYTLAEFKGSDEPYDETIEGKKAIIATTYGRGRVILSVVHPELTIGNTRAHDIFVRNILWLAESLPVIDALIGKITPWLYYFVIKNAEHPKLLSLLIFLGQRYVQSAVN